MPADPSRVKDLFLATAALPEGDRAAFLDRECGADAELRAAVERLLAAHAAPDSRIDRPASDPGATSAHEAGPVPDTRLPDTRPTDEAGLVLGGRYKLVELIGEGGMGSVWMARQVEPVRRAVAVKLIKPGMDSRAVLARFEAERQALALMDHPHIARVLDAGLAADGRPFFVMELVKGVPISQFCDERQLTPRQRLELFVPVCQAIQHAHQKGVIHRDIKPSNVLVALYDDRPVPKVIDFGVAKATGVALTEQTLHTGFGAVVGTLEYMSPEQASFNQLDVDTRSDVYALGALLYELLSGSPPFSRKELKRAGLEEMLRLIREQEPPRPSTRLSSSDALPSLSASRRMDPRRLTALVRGEIDWIVMKALEKDRTRRYETANGLAADVQRYLAGEPVLAAPAGAGYRLRKFVRRHRGPVMACALVLLALITGAVVAGWQAVRATVEERNARQQRDEAAAARDAEVLARRQADESRDAAVRASRQATDALQDSQRQAARLALQRGTSLIEQHDGGRGLLWLARAAQLAPAGAEDLQRVIRVTMSGTRDRLATPRAVLNHAGWVQAAAFSPDGKRFATAGYEDKAEPTELWSGAAHIWETATGRSAGPPIRIAKGIYAVAFSPDGKTLFTGSEAGEVQRWDVATGQPVGPPIRHAKHLYRLAVSPDGKTVLTGGADRTVRLWEVATGEILGEPLRCDDHLVDLSLSPDGRRVLTATMNGRVQVWDLATRKPALAPLAHPDEVSAAVFTRDGKNILTASGDTVRLWDAQTGQAREESLRFPSPVWALAASPRGKEFLAGCGDYEAYLRDAASGRFLAQPLEHQGGVHALAFSPDGRTAVTGARDRTARLWTLPGAEPIRVPAHPEVWPPPTQFSPNGRMVLTCEGKVARLWDTATGASVGQPMTHPQTIEAATFSPDSRVLVTGTADTGAQGRPLPRGEVYFWDVATSQPTAPPLAHPRGVLRVACSPDGKVLLAATQSRVAYLWDFATRQPLAPPLEYANRGSDVLPIALFSPDGRMVLTSNGLNVLQLWETTSGKPLGRPMIHEGSATSAAFSPDGKKVVSASVAPPLNRAEVRQWDCATAEVVGPPMPHHGIVWTVAFSPDGTSILSASSDNTCRIWDASGGQSRVPALQLADQVRGASFSRDGRTILTVSKGARLWDAATGLPLGAPFEYGKGIRGAQFSPDGESFLIEGLDDFVYLQRVPRALPGTVDQLVLWAQVMTGMELDANGGVVLLDDQGLQQRRARLVELEKSQGP
jgi:WD40 repeat protein